MTKSWKCVEWQNGKDDAFGDKRPLASGQLHTFFETTCNPYFLFLFYRTAAPHIGQRDQRDSQWIAMASTIQPRPEPNRVMGLTRHCYKTKNIWLRNRKEVGENFGLTFQSEGKLASFSVGLFTSSDRIPILLAFTIYHLHSAQCITTLILREFLFWDIFLKLMLS